MIKLKVQFFNCTSKKKKFADYKVLNSFGSFLLYLKLNKKKNLIFFPFHVWKIYLFIFEYTLYKEWDLSNNYYPEWLCVKSSLWSIFEKPALKPAYLYWVAFVSLWGSATYYILARGRIIKHIILRTPHFI